MGEGAVRRVAKHYDHLRIRNVVIDHSRGALRPQVRWRGLPDRSLVPRAVEKAHVVVPVFDDAAKERAAPGLVEESLVEESPQAPLRGAQEPPGRFRAVRRPQFGRKVARLFY